MTEWLEQMDGLEKRARPTRLPQTSHPTMELEDQRRANGMLEFLLRKHARELIDAAKRDGYGKGIVQEMADRGMIQASKEIEKLRALLRRVEWIDARWKSHWIECPLCHEAQPHSTPIPKHRPDCDLAAAIGARR